MIKGSYIIRTYHSFLPDDRHPVLHTIHSIRDLGEIVFTQGLLAHREGAVVCSCHTEIVTCTIDKDKDIRMIDRLCAKIKKKTQLTVIESLTLQLITFFFLFCLNSSLCYTFLLPLLYNYLCVCYHHASCYAVPTWPADP